MERPQIVLFDLNGTLTDPSVIGRAWGEPGLGLRVLEGAVRGGMTDALTGSSRPFSDHVAAALAVETARQGLDQAHIDDALQAASALPAWPDAREALERLDGAGLRLAVLTNSGADAGRSTLEQAGLLDLFELVVGVDEVETFKPDERTYAHAVSELGVRAGEVLLVAAHGWDVTGAGAAGLRTAWTACGEVVLAPTVPEPDLQVADLAALADAVLALADGP
jgi:2-haloacid dehalogenase